MMKYEKQLAIYMDNRPGMLARTCKALADAKINILALSMLDTVDHAIVRMVVDKPKEAEKELSKLHSMIQSRDVIWMEVPNQVGALAEIAQKLAARAQAGGGGVGGNALINALLLDASNSHAHDLASGILKLKYLVYRGFNVSGIGLGH